MYKMIWFYKPNCLRSRGLWVFHNTKALIVCESQRCAEPGVNKIIPVFLLFPWLLSLITNTWPHASLTTEQSKLIYYSMEFNEMDTVLRLDTKTLP